MAEPEKEYSQLEQKLYKTPQQEAAFLCGAFQTVSTVGIAVGVGPIPSLVYMVFADRYFSTPFRDNKELRGANLKGWIAGFATSLAVMYGVSSYFPADTDVDTNGEAQFERGAIESPATNNFSFG